MTSIVTYLSEHNEVTKADMDEFDYEGRNSKFYFDNSMTYESWKYSNVTNSLTSYFWCKLTALMKLLEI